MRTLKLTVWISSAATPAALIAAMIAVACAVA
jgi:hypothetical protein